ncbi:MAG TPA: glycosyltransferase family 9 protein, partial [Gammaproteobacteria bacterium]|nr:glycosyltransferase family 9 protein [Gammaproteobacteria bacterium]
MKILISRTDNIGDVILTLPIAGILKTTFPDCKIQFLARGYAGAVVKQCRYVDEFIDWEPLAQLSTQDLVTAFTQFKTDTILHVYPQSKIAKAAKKAGIKQRIGTSHRLYHWLTCNKRVNFSRKRSTLHEAQLNLNVLKPLGINKSASLEQLAQYTGLETSVTPSTKILAYLNPQRFNLVVHPGTNGNTKEWPTDHFVQLINTLPADQFNILITGTSKEQQQYQQSLLNKCPRATNLMGQLNLSELVDLLGAVDGIVVNSTGPLHIGAALGIHALGLFPPQPGKSPKRWGPIGKQAEYLVAEKPC